MLSDYFYLNTIIEEKFISVKIQIGTRHVTLTTLEGGDLMLINYLQIESISVGLSTLQTSIVQFLSSLLSIKTATKC